MSRGNPFFALRLSHAALQALRDAANHQGLCVSDVARTALAVGLLSHADTAAAGAAVREVGSSQKKRRPKRPPSRPQRLRKLLEDVQALIDEYQDWYESQPDSLREAPTGECLQEAIDGLTEALDHLEAIQAPRGFGRD